MTPTPREQQIVLRRKEDRRIRGGHPWVFSNEIRETRGSPGPGDVVAVLDAGGRWLGIGFYHPHSLIAVRLLAREEEEIDGEFFRRRIRAALETRSRLYPGESVYRLVHGEADFLPGLVIDRFNDLLVIQTTSAGMDRNLSLFCSILDDLLHPAAIIERNESPLRDLEELPHRTGLLSGTAHTTEILLDGLTYRVDALEGQKTGFFLDQRENRKAVAALAPGLAVLDCFCNEGGFALASARAGASTVTGVDASSRAIQRARENAERNALDASTFETADVFEHLKALGARGQMFDLIVLDPPSFTRNRKTVPQARQGYLDLHRSALAVLRRPGFLCTASCSYHITPETFLDIVERACRDAARPVQLLDWRGASPDHPVLPAVAETRYLKFGIFRVL
jgi:23S rRNA (cytosine1962-C5)-methyltransferase